MTVKKISFHKIAKTPDELADILELSPSEKVLMKIKAEVSHIAVRAIKNSGLTVNEIVKRSGVARSKVSAVKNGATVSASIDLLIKIIAAAGGSVKIRSMRDRAED